MLRDYFADTTRHALRQKRGGGAEHISLDFCAAEQRYNAEPADLRDPESLYHLAWSRNLLQTALHRLQESFIAVGKPTFFAEIQSHLEAEETAVPYAVL